MNSNKLNTLMSLATNNLSMQEYFNDIVKDVMTNTKGKMKENINNIINNYKVKTNDNWDNEVNLIKAVMPFVNKDPDNAENIADMYNNIKAWRMLVNDISRNNPRNDINSFDYNKDISQEINDNQTNDNPSDHSSQDRQGSLIIEDNTVYEIDESCTPAFENKKDKLEPKTLNKSSNLLLPLILLLLNKNI